MAHHPVNDGTCLFCGETILQGGVLYTHGELVTCPTCGRAHTVCCSDEDGLHLHSEEDDD